MLTHLVFFYLNDPDTDADELVDRLRAMKGRIPALLDLEAGRDVLTQDRSAHVALVTRHADADGLAAYAVHPVHQELLAWVKPRVARTAKVDFVV